MYQLIKNGKKTKLTFDTYEQARQYARKQARKHELWPFDRLYGASNPHSIKDYGFNIQHVG
jgi:hypothetical protein